MPSILCSSCSHRIVLPSPSEFCPNCGAPFMQSAIAGPSTSGDGQQMGLSLSAMPQARRRNAPPSPIIVTANASGGSRETGSMPPPGGYVSPRGMPKRPPELVGVVVNIQTLQLEDTMNQFSIFKLLRDIIWPSSEQARITKTTITTTRIRNNKGEERDARMEGDITNGSINMGDTLQIWGRMRKGTLRVGKLYNDTSGAQIRTTLHQADATVASLIATMVIMAVVILILMYVLQHNSASIIP